MTVEDQQSNLNQLLKFLKQLKNKKLEEKNLIFLKNYDILSTIIF